MPPDRPLAAILVRARLVLGAAALTPSVAAAEPPPVDVGTRTSASTDADELRRLAIAARQAGDLARYRDRLRELDALAPSREVRAELDRLAASYGEVEITGLPIPLVLATQVPSVEAVACMVHARSSLAQTGSYRGLLPVGEGSLGTLQFVVAPGANPPIDASTARDFPPGPAPTCGPCCHGDPDCPELYVVPPLPPPPALEPKRRRHRDGR